MASFQSTEGCCLRELRDVFASLHATGYPGGGVGLYASSDCFRALYRRDDTDIIIHIRNFGLWNTSRDNLRRAYPMDAVRARENGQRNDLYYETIPTQQITSKDA